MRRAMWSDCEKNIYLRYSVRDLEPEMDTWKKVPNKDTNIEIQYQHPNGPKQPYSMIWYVCQDFLESHEAELRLYPSYLTNRIPPKCLTCQEITRDNEDEERKASLLAAQKQQQEEENNQEIQQQRDKLVVPIEGVESLFSTVKSLRQIKLQHEGIIKNLNEEAEESTEIIKKMMKIIGIKTDDFSDCTGNIFAKKCLDRLNHEMGAI